MDFRTYSIGEGYDLDIVDGDLVVIGKTESTFLEAVAQRVRYRILTWLGESPYQLGVGIPYLDAVFGKQPLEGVWVLFYEEMLATDDVDAVENLQATLDPQTRILRISADIRVGAFVAPLVVELPEAA